jgi:hypothetical protein
MLAKFIEIDQKSDSPDGQSIIMSVSLIEGKKKVWHPPFIVKGAYHLVPGFFQVFLEPVCSGFFSLPLWAGPRPPM